jgi:hypothetical protein
MKFLPEHITNFKLYRDVQKSNRWNMLSPNAQRATGLERDDYLFVMEHYDELAKLAGVTP